MSATEKRQNQINTVLNQSHFFSSFRRIQVLQVVQQCYNKRWYFRNCCMTHPQLVSKRLSPTCREAMPKSAILMLFFSSSSKFSGFRSLWLQKMTKNVLKINITCVQRFTQVLSSVSGFLQRAYIVYGFILILVSTYFP